MPEEGPLLAVVPFLKEPTKDPFLEGLECQKCDAVFLDRRQHCARCGARHALRAKRLANEGRLHAFTIIKRSFPGVPVPYVSAVVDLDGGGCVKGNLRGIEAEPQAIEPGMGVRVIYEIAPQRDKEGNRYMAYFFEPLRGVRP